MVYKVSGEFESENLLKFIDKIKENFNIVYRNGNMYLAVKNFKKAKNFFNEKDASELTRIIREYLQQEVFLPQEDFWVKDLSGYNTEDKQIPVQKLLREDEFVNQWIQESMIRIEKERLEIEKQKELKQVWNNLDEIERALDMKVQEIFHKRSNAENKLKVEYEGLNTNE